jgi:UDP-glucose 4-epimerase
MENRILLIGGNGFIGSHLIDELLSNSFKVNVLDCQKELYRSPNSQVNYFLGSLTDLKLVNKASKDCDIIVHLAHSTIPSISLNHPEEEILDSIGAFVKMINSFKGKSPKKILFFSSGEQCMGIQKNYQLLKI